MKTLKSIFVERQVCSPNSIAYKFLKGNSISSLSYNELMSRALTVKEALSKMSVSKGDRVLVACKSQMNFIIGFFACIVGDLIAVPIVPPRKGKVDKRFRYLSEDAHSIGLIRDFDLTYSEHECEPKLHCFSADIDLRNISYANCRENIENVTQQLNFDQTVFLQYTSGSTGDPKGVQISNKNLYFNSKHIGISMDISGASRILTALPLFHDMGLIGGVVVPMFLGAEGYFIDPSEVVQFPERWIQNISDHKITHCGGPNYLYDLAINTVNSFADGGINLSEWKVAFCGAEPIRADILTRFSEAFKQFQFCKRSIFPCYGMAESTLFISGKHLDENDFVLNRNGVNLVNCGRVDDETIVQIVDVDTGNSVANGEVGEIWVSSPSVSMGYWRNQRQSEKNFRAQISPSSQEYFLRTGDLGFLIDENLYVCGRIKDVIITNGKNYAPQDIEFIVENSHPSINLNSSIAFSNFDTILHKELLYIVLESKRRLSDDKTLKSEIIKSIEGNVYQNLGLIVHAVIFVDPGKLPRTSSGKVRRSHCREEFGSLL